MIINKIHYISLSGKEERSMQIIGKEIAILRNSSDNGDVMFSGCARVLFIRNTSRDLVRIWISRSFSAVLKNTKRLSYKSTPPSRLLPAVKLTTLSKSHYKQTWHAETTSFIAGWKLSYYPVAQ